MTTAIQQTRVAVTGGAGFIGSHLCDVLARHDNEIVVVDNFATGRREHLSHLPADQLRIVEADVRDVGRLTKAFHGCRYVFHLATANVRRSLLQPTLVHETNATGTLNVLKAAASTRVEGFLYCSSSEIYGNGVKPPLVEEMWFNPATVYGASKLVGEYYTSVFHRSGWLSCTIARPHNNYGPREHFEGVNGEVIPRFILLALAGEPLPVFGDGSQTRDFTYVEDTAELLMALLANDRCRGQTVGICYGHEISVRDVAEAVIRATGSASRCTFHPERPNDVKRLSGDPTRLKQLLGRTPETTFEEGLTRTVAWFRNRVYLDPTQVRDLAADNWKEIPPENWMSDVSNATR